MTGKVVSLSRVRKARVRQAARSDADANAAKHGRTKAERNVEAARKALAEKRLDSHERSDD